MECQYTIRVRFSDGRISNLYKYKNFESAHCSLKRWQKNYNGNILPAIVAWQIINIETKDVEEQSGRI